VDALPGTEAGGAFQAGRALANLALAVRRDDRTWAGALDAARTALTQLQDVDAPWLLELAGRRGCDAGHTERARAVWKLASGAYRALGRPADAGRIERAIEALPRAGR
jgi:hypothetical protein